MRNDSTWMGAHDQGRFPFQQPEPPVLRLFVDDSPAPPAVESPGVAQTASGAKNLFNAPPTLGEFFEQYLLPYCPPKTGERNVDQYRESLKLWADLTGNPSLDRINAMTTARFVTLLAQRTNRKGEPISDKTVRKHCVCIQFCLDRAGPPSRRWALNAGLIHEPPGRIKGVRNRFRSSWDDPADVGWIPGPIDAPPFRSTIRRQTDCRAARSDAPPQARLPSAER